MSWQEKRDATAPGVGAVAVSPSDTTLFTRGPCRELYVGTGGTVVGLMYDGTTGTFTNVPNGGRLPYSFQRINSTNTTASAMVAIY